MDKHFENVLLIDDDSVSNFLNEMALQEMNFSDQVHISQNGKEALTYLNTICCKGKDGKNLCPDFIFLDINMPVMDGFQFLEEFQKLPISKRKSIPIVMLTSSNASSDLDRARQYNIDGYIVKPLCKEKVEKVLK